MASEEKGEEQQQAIGPQAAVGFRGAVEQKYRELREHAETYPYVWASYIVVYGGIALWTTYRWRRLRKTEDRVRALQERLRKHYAAEDATTAARSSTPVVKVPPSADKASNRELDH